MPVPFRPTRHSTKSDLVPTPQDTCPDAHGANFHAMRRQAGGGDETRTGERGGRDKCEKCGAKLLSVDYLHHYMLQGNLNDDPEEQLCCRKCALETKSEAGSGERGVESSTHVDCPECPRDFRTREALKLHSQQSHQQKQLGTRLCPCCDTSFATNAAVYRHIESGECRGDRSLPDFRKRIREKNAPFAKEGPDDILTGTTTTQTWRPGVLPPRFKTARAEIPGGFRPGKTTPRDPASVRNHTPPSKPGRKPAESLGECWKGEVGSYVCPRLMCGKKLKTVGALVDHLKSNAHDKKSFRCPACFRFFVSSSALLQHSESDACSLKRSFTYYEFIEGATGGYTGRDKKGEFGNAW
ncbi:hypothetical protein C7212DRAFT_341939 [Tuber magnatum]|uniref:C2H2-type domain-containing protein n=1 Tax=Tuber magnatum TaxID=42249 RepID=A0A317SZ07_9PEZI|nr:hypothetical protein C7212DRAFT_341939 [Tuber magnatum]